MVKKIGIVLVLGMAMVVCGCGNGTDDGDESTSTRTSDNTSGGPSITIPGKDGGKMKVDLDGKKVTFRSKDGKGEATFGSGAKLPDNFPKDVHVYAGAAVQGAAYKGGKFSIMLMTKDDAKTVLDTYRQKMKAEGWTEGGTMDMGPTKVAQFKKGERGVVVSATQTEGTTMVSVATGAD